MLCMIFAQECPVYAKAVNAPQRPPNPRPANRPPYPGYPPGPGYPTSGGSMPMPGMPTPHGGGGGNMPYGGSMPSHAGYPSHQPYPTPNNTSLPSYSTTQTPTSYPAVASNRQQQPRTTHEGLTGMAPQRQQSMVGEEHIRASLLSTAEDKLKLRVKELFGMGKVSILYISRSVKRVKFSRKEYRHYLAAFYFCSRGF